VTTPPGPAPPRPPDHSRPPDRRIRPRRPCDRRRFFRITGSADRDLALQRRSATLLLDRVRTRARAAARRPSSTARTLRARTRCDARPCTLVHPPRLPRPRLARRHARARPRNHARTGAHLLRISPGQLRVLRAERAVDVLEDGRQCRRRIGLFARGLEVDPHGAPAAQGVEVPLESHQRRGLTGLPAGVQREILALLDQLLDTPEAPLRREHVVLSRNARTDGVERQQQQ
jgi:hypothetical protein